MSNGVGWLIVCQNADGIAEESNDSDDWDDVPAQAGASKPTDVPSQHPAAAAMPEADRETSPPAAKAEIELSSDDDSVRALESPEQMNGEPRIVERQPSNKNSPQKPSPADLQTDRERLGNKKQSSHSQSAKATEHNNKAMEGSAASNNGQKESTAGVSTVAGTQAEPAQNNISPFKAKGAQQNPIPRDSPSKKASAPGKVEKGKAEPVQKAKKKLDLPAGPQPSKEAKGKGSQKAAREISNGRDKAGAEIHEARLKTSGAEPSQPASRPVDKQHNDSGAPAADTSRASSSDARKSHAIESGKAVQPNGKLRAFADPDELPQTKDESPHVEPTRDMPAKSVASEQKQAQEGGRAIEGGRSMDQLQNQSVLPANEGPQSNTGMKVSEPETSEGNQNPVSKAALEIPQSAEDRGKAESGEGIAGASESAAQGLHNPESNSSRQQPRPQEPAPESFSSFAAAVDTATPMGNGTAARPQPAAQATAAEPKKRPGLRPIPDSTMLDPDPEAGRGQNGAHMQRGGPPRGLRPIPDSTILEPGSPSEILIFQPQS